MGTSEGSVDDDLVQVKRFVRCSTGLFGSAADEIGVGIMKAWQECARAADLWILGTHRVPGGDALSAAGVAHRCGSVTRALMVTDPGRSPRLRPTRDSAGPVEWIKQASSSR
jgi:hypothetical protein